MKGSFAISTYIMLIGKLVVEITLLSIFTSHVIIPGISAAEVIESVALSNSVASTINALSVQEEGEIRLIFSKEFLVITGTENRKNFISIDNDEKRVYIEARLKNLLHERANGLIIKKERSSDLIEVLIQ